MAVRTSAGILLFRWPGGSVDRLEVLLAHPGGPYFAKRDLGDWTIPKGEIDAAEGDLNRLARQGALGSVPLETQQFIMLHKVLKPGDQPLTKARD